MVQAVNAAEQTKKKSGKPHKLTTEDRVLLSLEYLMDSGACVLGTPEECIETCRRYEAAGVDQLLCLVNPYKIGHDAVMQTIQMMGEHVIPAFR